MKKINHYFAFLFFLFIQSHILNAQNWDVFNKNYRYNYKYNNSSLVSNVMFVDTIKQTGNDTTYCMNRIGVECTGSCPTLTTPISATTTVIIPNMPQFLQRKIKKYANGLVMLQDTAKLVIHPKCQVNQSWLFDSVNNVMATCLNKISQVNFGINDSVRIILLGTNDTLKLSKQFGLIQFPTLYNQNKYYRLVGIEKTSSYDSTALYGLKVPNYWDFYKYNVGDKFCFEYSWYKVLGSGGNISQGCYFGNYTILSRTIQNNTYNYLVNGFNQACGSPTPTVTNTLQPTNGSPFANENTMYPGQLIQYIHYPQFTNIVKFGSDMNGIFYKYAGRGCTNYGNLNIPFSNEFYALKADGSYYLPNQPGSPGSYYKIDMIYGVGLGKLSDHVDAAGYDIYCLTGVVKNGSLYFGTETFVGLNEKENNVSQISVFPNPTNGNLSLNFGTTEINEIKVCDLIGQEVLTKTLPNNSETCEINFEEQNKGIYFVQLYQNGKLLKATKIIKN